MSANPIWAVARNTIAQAIRIRVAFVIMVLYLVLVPAIPFVVEGDGTLRGQLHVVITYSLMAAGGLLGILTLALSTTTLWSEIHEKQIFLLETKPIRRWQILLGKLLGILAINAALLAFMGLVTWVCVQYLAGQSRWSRRERAIARQQVLTARRVILPETPPEVERFVERHFQKRFEGLKRKGQVPPGGAPEVRKRLREAFLNRINAVRFRWTRIWQFKGVPSPRRRDVNITIRLKFFSSDRQSEAPNQTLWGVGKPQRGKPFYRHRAGYQPEEVHEFQVPSDAVDEDGSVEVHFLNIERRAPTLVFAGEDAIQVLAPVSGFGWNLGRGLALIFVEVLFLAIIGLFCSTFMGFPVSPIVALAILVLIYLTGAVRAEFERGLSIGGRKRSQAARIAEYAVRGIAAGVQMVLPPLGEYSPSALVSSGEEVSWFLVLKAIVLVAILRGGLFVLLGTLIFERRELAVASR